MTTSLPKKSVENAIDERSGRFFGLNRTECGLHTHLQKVKALKKQKKESGEELEVPELKCEKCIELNAVNFVETVVQNTNNIEKNEGSLLLLEFYSPFCGSCQEFAPTLNRLANDQIHARVARFDITEQSIPKINNKEIFKVEATPTLYLVRNSPSFYAERYTGKHHEYDDILRWLAKRSSFK
jgi:thiol-disulfide isomerase/thioredoxin